MEQKILETKEVFKALKQSKTYTRYGGQRQIREDLKRLVVFPYYILKYIILLILGCIFAAFSFLATREAQHKADWKEKEKEMQRQGEIDYWRRKYKRAERKGYRDDSWF